MEEGKFLTQERHQGKALGLGWLVFSFIYHNLYKDFQKVLIEAHTFFTPNKKRKSIFAKKTSHDQLA